MIHRLQTRAAAIRQRSKHDDLFIDTNVFLSFYHLSSDDLEELRKLAVLLDKKKVTLWIPKQVMDEFGRNREAKIADALKRFRDDKLNDQFPQICKEYEEYGLMRDAIIAYKQNKAKLLEKLTAEISTNSLKADKTIIELFGKAKQIDVTAEIVSKARVRMIVGNPPGKNDSTGDAINWECLLEALPDWEDLLFITDDSDYASPLDGASFLQFLQSEWRARKFSEVRYFNRLSAFFRNQFPDIHLAMELEKEILIGNLTNSPNFASTRSVLNQLVKYGDFTATQVNDIVQAAITNNQVYWIAKDEDINENLRQLVKNRENQIEPNTLNEFRRILGEAAAPVPPPSFDDTTF